MQGDPFVTDGERAEAGLVTVAGRQADLDIVNRDRARARWQQRSVPLGECENIVRVWPVRSPSALRRRLGDESLSVWSAGDIFHVLWRGEADAVHLAGSVQLPLWPVANTDLWELSVLIRDLDRAALEVVVLPLRRDESWPSGPAAASAVWRGPLASPPPVRSHPLRGRFVQHRLPAPELGGHRVVTVYRPPGRTRQSLAVVYLADGGSQAYAEVVEAAISDGRLPPLLLVGIAHGGVVDGVDRRAQEYLYGRDRRRFVAHERFVLQTVLPWAERRFGASDDRFRRVVAGCSNGAAWALAVAHRHPARFGTVVGFSVAGPPPGLAAKRLSPRVRHCLVVGTLEHLHTTRAWADALAAGGAEVAYRARTAGHDFQSWVEELPGALSWAFGSSAPRTRPKRNVP